MLEQLKKIYGFQPGAGFVETDLPGVRFFWSTEPVERAPLIYNAGLVVVLQGSKTGFLDGHVFHYGPDQYLVLSVPVPFECETKATPEDPLLGLFIDISREDLFSIVKTLPAPAAATESGPVGAVTPAPMSQRLQDSVERLIQALCIPGESHILGPGIKREILYHAIQGPYGAALRALAQVDSHFDRVSRSITLIREHYRDPISVEEMAQEAGMSAPVFHRAFKNVTGSSPHQYLKVTRLNRAKGFILTDGVPVSEVARRVGYDNAAHFSRAFRSHFGVSPRNARESGYTPIDI